MQRLETNLDFDWRFHLGDPEDAAAPDLDDSAWRRLDLPHDWSIEGNYSHDHPSAGFGAYLPNGTAWYRRRFQAPADWRERRTTMVFDGVFADSVVWVNGVRAGGRAYGFLGFTVDVSELLRDGENLVAVHVRNTPAPAARWYTGAGIYGHVWLRSSDRVHLVEGGTFVRTLEADAEFATLAVSSEIRNLTASLQTGRIVTRVRDADDQTVAEETGHFLVEPGAVFEIDQTISVSRPRLWSPAAPNLYSAEQELLLDHNTVDLMRTAIGIRTIRWDADTGFHLNGEPLKLQGVCEHHDGGPVGAAQPDDLVEIRLRQLQAMGANAVRTAHNPRTPVFYDLCDRLGLLVMDEIFDGWQRKAEFDYGARFFDQCWRKDVNDWVRRDRNHPCIIIYSIGNETGEADVHDITGFLHRLDPTRPTTGGTMTDGVDVVGLNGPAEILSDLHACRARYPDKPFVLTESPHTYQTRGYYKTLNWWRDPGRPREDHPPYAKEEAFPGGELRYSSSYDNATIRITARDHWRHTVATPWVAGEFRWTGFDYLGEAGWTAGGWPARLFNHGIIDLAGFPKDHYHFYRSVWTQDPMVHLLPHWTHPGRRGTPIPVVAYTNAPEVELYLNDRSLGRRKRSDRFECVWTVPYEPGVLEARALDGDRVVSTTRHRTAGPAASLALTVDRGLPDPDRRSLGLLTIAVTDMQANVVPHACHRVEFLVEGPVELLGFENGDPIDTTPHRKSWRRVFHGLARGFFRSGGSPGDIQVTAAAILGEQRFQDSTTVSIVTTAAALRSDPSPASWEIYYTLDGTRPTTASARYKEAFTLKRATRVRALLRRSDGRELRTATTFTNHPPPALVDPRFDQPGRPPHRPLDPALAGIWTGPRGRFELVAGGSARLTSTSGDAHDLTWWYARPNDPFEHGAADFGLGELSWPDGRAVRIRLVDEAGTCFSITTGKALELYHRKD